MNDRLLSLLGLCRKAGRLSWGHDACLVSIMNDKAFLCLLASDASDRLKNEIGKAASYNGRTLKVIITDYTMDDIKHATGYHAGVLTIDDEGFAAKAVKLYTENQGGISI